VILSVYDDMVIYICCKNMNNQNPIKNGYKILLPFFAKHKTH
jgi:hypothetical protein